MLRLFVLLVLSGGCHAVLPLDAKRGDAAGKVDVSAGVEMGMTDVRPGDASLPLDGAITCGGTRIIDSEAILQRSDHAGVVLGDGTVHTVYGTKKGLKHAAKTNNGWVIEVVDSTADAGRDAALALDTSGTLHALYLAGGEIRWARKEEGKGWSLGGPLGPGEGHTSLAADQAGLHASLRRSGSLWYVHLPKGSSTWNAPKLIASPGGWDSSLAVDSAGNVHIAHGTDGPGSEVRYVRRIGSNWRSSEPRGSQTDVGVDNSVAVDGKGVAYIAHHERILGKLLLTTSRSGGTWDHEILDQGPGAGSYPSIVVEGATPHIVYRRFATPQQLVYLHLQGSRWVSAVVDESSTGNDLGRYSSVGLDASGRVHVTYAGPSRELLYAVLCP